MKKDKGFTLIEVIVVIAIIGIVSAIAIPNYIGWLSDTRLKSAVGDLKSDMNIAKIRAIRENASVAVAFNIAANKYEIFVDNGAGGGTANDGVRNGGEALIKSATMPAGVTTRVVNFNGARCRFNGSGLPLSSDLVPPSDPVVPDVFMENTKHMFRGISLSRVGTIRIMTRENSGATWKYWEPKPS